MVNITRILCPIDFSEFSRHALDYAAGIARWYGARITTLHVVPLEPVTPPTGSGLYPPLALTPDDLQQYREELTTCAGVGGVDAVDIEVAQGSVSGEIVRFANELPADLLVMGTHGRSGFDRLMLGSVTEKVLRKVSCPVLTVPAHAPDDIPAPIFRRVLCAVDFSPPSLVALALAQSIAGEAAANLCVMHVLEPVSVFDPVVAVGSESAVTVDDARREARDRLDRLVRDDTRAFTDVQEVVASGKAYREILRAASEQRSDLIVLGAHGTRLGLPAFGSTTNQVVRQATCPVLTVRG
jgi:nucleotide-binding universal stress UspA family protein